MFLIKLFKFGALSILLGLLLVGCSDSGVSSNNCEPIIDSVKIVDIKTVGNKTYYLVHRISGWHDKTEILQLFTTKPVFDRCNRNTTEPVFDDSIDSTMAISHIYLDVNMNNLEVLYKKDMKSDAENQKFKLEIKPKT